MSMRWPRTCISMSRAAHMCAALHCLPRSTTSTRCSMSRFRCSGTGDVFECARTRLCYGERLRRANRRRDARRELALRSTRSRSCARLHGPTRPPRAPRKWRASPRQTPEARDDLTPQERQIAALAAEGRTNREIGALLFLSPRTIETHLGRVFRKLGISYRSALSVRSPTSAEAALHSRQRGDGAARRPRRDRRGLHPGPGRGGRTAGGPPATSR